jgi:hypothetical protein
MGSAPAGGSAAKAPIVEKVVMVNLKDFAERAAALPEAINGKLVTEQFAAALGGISNLYLTEAARQGKSRLEVQTVGGFVSDLVPREHILQVIHDCARVNRKRSKPLLTALEITLNTYADAVRGERFHLGSLGVFRRTEGSTYQFKFRDPDSL